MPDSRRSWRPARRIKVELALFLVVGFASLVLDAARMGPRELRKKAVEMAQAGDCKSSIDYYQRLLELKSGQIHDDFNNLGVCLHEEARFEEAQAVYDKGLSKYYHSEKLHTNKGSLLEEWANKEAVARRLEWTDEIDERSYNATKHLTFALRLKLGALWEKHSSKIPEQNRIDLGKLTVAIFCHRREEEDLGEPAWGPRKQDTDGLQPAGHEESVLFMARHLVADGFNVEVYTDVKDGEMGMDSHGVMWRPYYAIHALLPPARNETHVMWPKLPTEKQPDIFISWGNVEGAALFNVSLDFYAAKKLRPPAAYLWAHDPIHHPAALTPRFLRHLHAVIVPSEFHKALLPARVQPCAVVAHDAVHQAAPYVVRQTDNSHVRLAYAAAPQHGLLVLLRSWADIRSAAFKACEKTPTLYVVHGLTDFAASQYQGSRWYDDLTRQLGPLLDQTGVKDLGKVSHRKLSKILSSSGFYLYPTSGVYSRTVGTVTGIIKAMMMGAIPITSRHVMSNLNETCGLFDLGPPPGGGRIESQSDWIIAYIQAIVNAVCSDEEELKQRRESMIAWSRDRFDWGKAADAWGMRFRAAAEKGDAGACGAVTPPPAEAAARLDAFKNETTGGGAAEGSPADSDAPAGGAPAASPGPGAGDGDSDGAPAAGGAASASEASATAASAADSDESAGSD